MSQWRENRINELTAEAHKAEDRIGELAQELERIKAVRLQIIGAVSVLKEESAAEAEPVFDQVQQPANQADEPVVAESEQRAEA